MRPPPIVSTDLSVPDLGPVPRTFEPCEVRGFDCDVCGRHFDGEPAGSGLFLWSRGDEVRYEEPPLCEECASKVTLGALLAFDVDGEEEG